MTQHNQSNPTLRDVLGYFVAEEKHDKATLDRYLTEYPDYMEEIIEAAFEFEKPEVFDTAPLSQDDLSRIEAGKKRFLEATARKNQGLSATVEVEDQRRVAKLFDIPRTVIVDLLSYRIRIASVPNSYLSRLVAALGLDETVFRRNYGGRLTHGAFSYSYSSDGKPKPFVEIEFEQYLVDAGVSKERVARILTEG